ncbi:hypothetical protein G5V59_06110 [Nocardioides sp. W3-2-3]|uniref:hypothetical protein n=1 Tax=Nocardioides convexus TaxID=2712224 RepID=UPI002418A7DF|nr:hypothetical protein [Nocardioides convexus]NGZ99956.1 hypothetical protein [Nocardioides convexus]
MPTVNLGPVPGSESPVVVPGRVRLELARLVALAQDASVRLPFDVAAVEAALAVDPADGTAGTAADEARRAWYARLSSETPSPEDALAGLLAQQAGRAHAAADDPEPEAEAGRTALREALTVLGRPEALLEVELGLRLGAGAPEQVRAWVAVHGQTAVSLGTVSGADFELSWGAVAALPEMLAHLVRLPVTTPPEEDAEPVVPSRFTLPVEPDGRGGGGRPATSRRPAAGAGGALPPRDHGCRRRGLRCRRHARPAQRGPRPAHRPAARAGARTAGRRHATERGRGRGLDAGGRAVVRAGPRPGRRHPGGARHRGRAARPGPLGRAGARAGPGQGG